MDGITTTGGTFTFDGLATEGYLVEANIGYDWEFGERWVAGVVLAAEYISASVASTVLGVATLRAEADDFGFDALGRVGYKFNDYTLGYVIGGHTLQRGEASISVPSISLDKGLNAVSIGTGTERKDQHLCRMPLYPL